MEKKIKIGLGLLVLVIAIVLAGGWFISTSFRLQKIKSTECNLEDIRESKKFEGLVLMHAVQKDLTDEMKLFLYFDHELNNNEIQQIEQFGIIVYKDSWIPPVGANPLGFYSAKSRVADICKLANLDLVKRVASGERLHEPLEKK